ncbi:hypothetical protein D3C74_263650 [compost metagenome]
MHPVQMAALNVKFPRFRSPAAQDHGVEFIDELLGLDILADLRIGDKFNAFRR